MQTAKEMLDSETYTCPGREFSKKDKGKLITFADGHSWKIKKVIDSTTVTVRRPWVKWFWKIYVPRWMMYRISINVTNCWKSRLKYPPGYFYVIFFGCELSHGGKFGTRPGKHKLDVTVCDFGFQINIDSPESCRFHGMWSPEVVKKFNENPRPAVPFNKIKEE